MSAEREFAFQRIADAANSVPVVGAGLRRVVQRTEDVLGTIDQLSRDWDIEAFKIAGDLLEPLVEMDEAELMRKRGRSRL